MGNMLDIFNGSAFTTTTLTDAMRDVKYVPSYISSLGLFQTTNIDTLQVAIEKDKDQLQMILTALPRGGPGQTFGKNKRLMRNLTINHYQVDDAIMAEEVQGVRAFGEQYATESMIAKIAERAADISQFFAMTEEFHRLKLITDGVLYDSDGTTELYNYWTEFEVSQPAEIDWDLDNGSPAPGALRNKCTALRRSMATALGGLPYRGILAIADDTFFDMLVAHTEVRETYLGYEAAASLRTAFGEGGQTNTHGQIDFGGIRWVNYRGGEGDLSSTAIGSGKVHFIPLGVPGLFRTVYGPADYIETVNRPGQRLYAHQYPMENRKGVNLEFQSNVLHWVSRPQALLRGKAT